ncbi:MAG: hypothetical protein H5U18_07990, partial [Rhodobacteraceae bacterium]|nr:hypothetical protein [Paracoccaceae bacterium]
MSGTAIIAGHGGLPARLVAALAERGEPDSDFLMGEHVEKHVFEEVNQKLEA